MPQPRFIPAHVISTHATRAGRVTPVTKTIEVSILFQLTRRARGESNINQVLQTSATISTHATRAGRVRLFYFVSSCSADFNSRDARGASRAIAFCISRNAKFQLTRRARGESHASFGSTAGVIFQLTRRARGESFCPKNSLKSLQFQLTRRARGESACGLSFFIHKKISTHATRAGRVLR